MKSLCEIIRVLTNAVIFYVLTSLVCEMTMHWDDLITSIVIFFVAIIVIYAYTIKTFPWSTEGLCMSLPIICLILIDMYVYDKKFIGIIIPIFITIPIIILVCDEVDR